MASSEKLERFAVIVTVCCTLLLTVLGVSRHFGYGGVSRSPSAPVPTRVPNWDSLVAGGHRIGGPAAKVTVVEFGDFECPVCQQFARVVKPALIAQFGQDLAFVYRHFPLDYHRFAMPYALASECAAEQDRFWEFHDLVYAKSDSIGLKALESFAKDAGVREMSLFKTCMKAGSKRDRITRDMAQAKQIGLTGTPTVVVNGMRLMGNDSAFMIAEVKKALSRTR